MARFTCSFVSYTLDRAVDITVVVPSPSYPDICTAKDKKETVSHSPKDPYPVLYLLHGYSGNHSSWTSYANTEMFAEERKIAVVMLSAENKAYIDSETDLFFDFLSKELPDFVAGMFPISKRREDTYIAGLSMGGYGTMIHAMRNPEQFCACGSFSGAVLGMPLRGKMPAPEFDTVSVIKDQLKAKADFPKIYISCGEKDFLYDTNVEFIEFLKEKGLEHTWVTHPSYGHEWRFWNEQIEAFLDWIPRTDAYKDTRTAV